MAYTLINGHKVPLTELDFYYVKNGEFDHRSDLRSANLAAHFEGDGSGRVYSLETYALELPILHIEMYAAALLPVDKDRPFTGSAAYRHLKQVNGCLHENTGVDVRADYPVKDQHTETVTCLECPAVLSREISTNVDGNKNVISLVLGGERNSDIFFSAVPSAVDYDEFLLVDNTRIPLVYKKFAASTSEPFEPPVTFDTAEEAARYALGEGDGRLQYMVSKLYHYITPSASYEVEITELVPVEGLPSHAVAKRHAYLAKQQNCLHVRTTRDDNMVIDSDTVEYSVIACAECAKELEYKYYVDSCQLEYTKVVMARTEAQKTCAHIETTFTPTPANYLECLLLDVSISVSCARCEALLYTVTSAYEEILLDYKSTIAATSIW